MQFGKKLITVTICLITFAISPAYAAKSVFIISKHAEPSQAQAYAINGTQIDYQAQVDIDTYNPGYGAVGNAVWSDKELMFVTYEESPMIVWASTKTLKKVGEFDTGIYDLAGIAIDTNREKIYIVQRETNNLYVYSFNQANNALVLDNHYILEVPSGYLNAWGLALDETNSLLYISTDTERVHVYKTTDWSYDHYIDINVGGTNRQAVGIAIDPIRGYLYTGDWDTHTYLVRTNIVTQASVEVEVTNGWYGMQVIGIDVDEATGLVYCTTYHHDFRVYDWNLVLKDTETNGFILGPAGVAVGGWYKADRLSLSKSDSVVDCVSPDQQFTYSIEYGGNGYGDTSVVITDTLPLEVTYISSSTGGQYDGLKHTVTWNLGDISAWQSGTLQIQVALNCHADPGGTITNVVEMEGINYYSKQTLGTQVCCYDSGPIIYVDKNATGCGNGTSWDNAYIDLQKALTRAGRCPGATAIWVAAGTYKPTTNPADSGATFELVDGVDMYGHFGGVGTYEDSLDDRNFANPANKTTLDGQIGVNPSDAVQHVVTAKNIGDSQDTIVDGFTITGSSGGAGISIEDCQNSKLIISKCNLKDNDQYGIYATASTGPSSYFTVQDCQVTGNSKYGLYCQRHSAGVITATTFDGNNKSECGIFAEDLSCVDLTNCVLENHTGSAVYTTESDLNPMDNCRVTGNAYGISCEDSFVVITGSTIETSYQGEGLWCISGCDVFCVTRNLVRSNATDGIYLEEGLTTEILDNWIYKNGTDQGNEHGCGIYLKGPINRPLIRNNTICDNRTYGIYFESGTEPDVVNCIVYGNTTQIGTGSGQPLDLVTYSCVQGGYPGYGNRNVNPEFVNPLNGNYHLKWESECVDNGKPNSTDSGETDIDGNPRVMGTYVDIGGDEDFPHCFPDSVYNDWVSMGRPNCWMTPYQCAGDADCATEGVLKWRVALNDLNLVIANWKKKITDPTLNPCADIDHKSEGALKFRVALNDLNIIIANWKKKDADLPGDCVECQQYQKAQGKMLTWQGMIKWIEQVWLEEKPQKLIDKDLWLKFMESLKEEL